MKPLLIILLIAFASCNPVSKAIRTLDGHPAASALYCATRYPVKDSTIKGDTVTIRDTTTTTDSVRVDCPPNQPVITTVVKPCPPSRTINITNTIHDTVIRRDRAAEQVLTNSLTDCQTTVTRVQSSYEDMKGKRDWWRIVALCLMGVVGVYVLLKVKKVLPF